MSGMEFIPEAMELAESGGMSELLEQKEALQGQLEVAQEAGNVEKANFFRGELARLDEKLAQQAETTGGMGRELSFGRSEGRSDGHIESYWREKAVKEAAEHGTTTTGYKLYVKRADEARADYLRRETDKKKA